ncbi:PREDICTED: cyclin-D3-1-like [Nicotiana attenuata]|uniref:Cyclin-d3-1 n=1 Tax=Nicotiana attenuata TaxID=49451 RepID=A0A314LEJ6_NICAT|nr:PREDICTED: cyclin-D3-1-like [Nicotiana attenuata]OIT40003.1 cyclin-d3-1 [Nicotiana attenuata]
MAHHYNQPQHQKLPFLLDSLYCKDESLDALDRENCLTEEVEVNPNSISLLEQDLLWEEEELSSLMSKEQENQMSNVVINNPYLSVARREAVHWILEAIAYHNFSAQTAILAVNYFDRFLFSFQSQSEKPWMNQLAAVSCLSLAAKVEEIQVPLLLDLQVEESRYLFEPRTIQRMELLILSTLKWKMNPVTPFSFLDYFSRRLGFNNHICYELLRRCERVLLSTITDCRFMCYLPSAVAAATMLHVIDRLEPCIEEEYQEQLLGILGIVKDDVTDCYRLVQEVASNIDFNSNKRKSIGALPGSPVGVMDVSFSSNSSPEPLSKKIRTQT